MRLALETALIANLAFLLGMATYSVVLVMAGAIARRETPAPSERRRRFAVLVPAHNEEALIARTLDSLDHLDYPRHLFDIHVIADNCDDATAAIARGYTRFVHERDEPSDRGKGQALRWLLDRLPGGAYDAFAVVDADSVVSRNLLSAFNDRMESGFVAVQAYYGVLNPERSWVSALRGAAFCILQGTRRRGLSALGASAGLGGNGMAFSFELKAARNWDAFSVTEDLELHAKLVVAGVKVAFAPEAVVLGEMPDSLAAARDQNLRWERGRLALARAYAPGLLADGLRSRRWPSLAAAFDLMIPPLSTHGLMGGVLLAVAIFIGSPVAIGMAAAVLAGIAVYVIAGLAAARAPLRLWLALGFAPLFIVWKAWLYAGALVSRRKPSWTRTRRLNSGDEAR